ncbi:GNAT family N-acetyltransferase [Stappia sp. 28M-7]|uniref:GNAT family N-acetyltransferase n=1 Tax=Stappia sp. 28M-7 TaxID=2762596 RepID=UPI00163BEF46|nr:GNAT family N-acetyltransferase [Stappia sp. 28M-7]MBC2860421.1 GNAT family N-acetyltransferase [Stappia sp. 28M-7]
MTSPTLGAPALPAIAGRPPLAALWAEMDELSPRQLHAMLRLRVDVFVVEQACPYPEIDGRDPQARHLLVSAPGENGPDDENLAACLRLLRPQAAGEPLRIGRIVVAPAWRGTGLGDYLMRAALAEARRIAPGCPQALSAQAHLTAFYAGHGFMPVSETYLEDGIPHVDMLRDPASHDT